ncbi:hypothetical protein WJX81_006327 [Elliptochloris bilobata]|uniref:Gamma-tubulin complex component n=1 Tax=Elliptochloris bilobata TaxID=381761 RepID=A0AAW1RJN4_9CHLO
MSAVNRQTAELLQRLVDGSLAGCSDDSAAVEAAARRVLTLALKTFNQAFAVPQLQQDEHTVMYNLRRRLAQLGHAGGAARADELQLRLVMSGYDPGARLGLLSLLAQLPTLAPGEVAAASSSWRDPQQAAAPGGALGGAAEGTQGPALQRAWGRGALAASTAGAGGWRGRSRLAEAGPRTDFEVSEAELVREVLCACQAVDGRVIRYSGAAAGGRGGAEIAPEAGVPLVHRQAVLRLCELGWLFRRVRSHAQGGPPGGVGEGAIRRAFRAALQRELAGLYQLLAHLDSLAAHPPPPGGDARAPYLTLRRLEVWLAEPTLRLRTLAALADQVAGLAGGELVAATDAAAQHGQPAVRSTVERCLLHAGAPLLEMVRRWLFEGRLANAPGDFFITASPDPCKGAGALWRSGYRLEDTLRPPFIPPALAHKLLRAGKSLNFLRECCGDVVLAQGLARTTMAAAAAQLSYGQTADLEALVDAAAAGIDRHVTSVLLGKHRFVAHCDAIKRYLLLGQGDFVAALMEGLGESLGGRAGGLSEYTLAGRLDAAVRASSAQFDDPDTLARLRIRLARATASETGWDVFSLRYAVDEPLATVLTAAAEAAYQRVAALLWALKRAEHSLGAAWLLLNAMQRQLARLAARARAEGLVCPGAEGMWAELRRAHATRSEMAHLAGNLQAYLMCEVLERAWAAFTARLASVTDLDGLIGAHAAYLGELQSGALLGEGDAELQRELSLLLRTLLLLTPPLRRLHLLVEGAAAEVAARSAAAAQRTALRQWASSEADAPLLGIPQGEVAEVRGVLAGLATEYATRLRTFVALLPTQTPVDLNFLLFRLEAGKGDAAAS